MNGTMLGRPALLVAAFTLAWAVIERLGATAGVSPYQVVWTRYGVHLALLALIFGRRRGLGLVRSRAPVREVFSSLLMLAMPVLFLLAVREMPAQDVMAIFWVAPVLVVIASAMASRDVGGASTVVAAALGLLGAVLICRPDAHALAPYALWAVGMAASFALYLLTVGSMHDDTVLTKLFHTALWVFVALTVVLRHFWHTPTARGFAAMVLIGAIGCVGLYALDLAVDAVPPALLAPVLYTQLVWDLSLQAMRGHFHPPAPDRLTLVGVACVIAAAMPAFALRVGQPGGAARPPA